MPKKKENINFEVVTHFIGNKTIKDLIENLIVREIDENGHIINKEKINRQ